MDPGSSVEIEYRKRIDGMTIARRMGKTAELLAWSRGFVARPCTPVTSFGRHGPS